VPHLGVPELLIILLIIIIVFGVGKLPELGGALGRSIREFRKATSGLDEEEKEKERKISCLLVPGRKISCLLVPGGFRWLWLGLWCLLPPSSGQLNLLTPP
jgi:sec-independent protein translocase protein TatA